MSQALPWLGAQFPALTLGVTRPVHLTQQKRTGRPSGSGSSLGQPLAGPHTQGSLSGAACTVGGAGRGHGCGVCPGLLGYAFWSALLFQADGVSSTDPSPRVEPHLPETLTFLSPWALPCLPPWSWLTELT